MWQSKQKACQEQLDELLDHNDVPLPLCLADNPETIAQLEEFKKIYQQSKPLEKFPDPFLPLLSKLVQDSQLPLTLLATHINDKLFPDCSSPVQTPTTAKSAATSSATTAPTDKSAVKPVVFEVESTGDVRVTPQGREYYIKWKGFSVADNTWEPEANLSAHTLWAFWNTKGNASWPAELTYLLLTAETEATEAESETPKIDSDEDAVAVVTAIPTQTAMKTDTAAEKGVAMAVDGAKCACLSVGQIAEGITQVAQRQNYGIKPGKVVKNEDSDPQCFWRWDAVMIDHIPKTLHADLLASRKLWKQKQKQILAVTLFLSMLTKPKLDEVKLSQVAERVDKYARENMVLRVKETERLNKIAEKQKN